jgi:hypothetical protein
MAQRRLKNRLAIGQNSTPKFHTYEARRLNSDRQAQIEGRAVEILFLESLRAIGHVEKIGRYWRPATITGVGAGRKN